MNDENLIKKLCGRQRLLQISSLLNPAHLEVDVGRKPEIIERGINELQLDFIFKPSHPQLNLFLTPHKFKNCKNLD
jgi:hypothetical protein